MAVMANGQVEIHPVDPRRLESFIGIERVEQLVTAAADLRDLLDGSRVVNVNSTAAGGGVAEMLGALLGYVRGLGIETTWQVIAGDPRFFAITKRIHNGLYGSPGDSGDLGECERAHYEETMEHNLARLRRVIRQGDFVIVHDPQPAGLVGPLAALGARVIWRCHVGFDGENEWTDRAWAFIRPFIEDAHAYVFSRAAFAPAWIDQTRVRVIPPSIDPFAPKNQELLPVDVLGLLTAAGIVSADGARPDARVRHRAQVVAEDGAVTSGASLVVQVSRWDRLKDMEGVLHGFVRHVRAPHAQLVLAGPEVDGVDDDPEGGQVWRETVAAWRALAPEARARARLVAIPMDDPVENALVVNALQRHADVVVQKSLAEGFGLTVAEALWKARPVVASAVGGIVDQIVDGETGLLVDDPYDLEAFGRAVDRLLDDRDLRERLAWNGRRFVGHRFLGDRQLLDYASLLLDIVGGR
jgi:trehalose synthase